MKTDTKIRRKFSASGDITAADSIMDGPIRSKPPAGQTEKVTRWDRITKKHLNAVTVQTSQVRRFFDLNLVSGAQQQEMGGRGCGRRRRTLDPALVMDMRHEIIRRDKPDPNKIKTADTLKDLRLERIRIHHQAVEQKYVDKELEKFRASLRTPRSSKKSEIVVKLDNYCTSNNDDHSIAATQCPFDNDSEDNFDFDTMIRDIEIGDGLRQTNVRNNGLENQIKDIEDTWADKDLQDILQNSSHSSPKSTHRSDYKSMYSPECEEAEKARKCVRFDTYVKQIQTDCVPCSEDNYMASATSSYSFEDQTSSDCYIKKNPEPMRLIGTQMQLAALDPVGLVPSEYPEPIVEINCTKAPNPIAPVLTVTKLDTQFHRQKSSSTTMTVSMVPKVERGIEENEIISELFRLEVKQLRPEADLALLRSYFKRWIHFTTMEKISNASDIRNESRSRKIEQFLLNIQREKKRTATDGANGVVAVKAQPVEANEFLKRTFNSKLKVQRDIIELQKIKLERQERMITELKLNRLADDTRMSQANSKQELRKLIRNGNAKSRAAAKCLQMVGNMRDPDDETALDEYAVIQAKGMPKFLVDMQTRALERNARHQEARERREQQEREKEEQRLAAEAAKLRQDEEAKRQRIEELREKRRLERLQRQQREEERVRYLDNVHKADQFNRKRLLTHGMSAFHGMIKLKRRNYRKMEMFRVFIVLRTAFRTWHEFVVAAWAERKRQADECRRLQLLRFGMDAWKKYQAMQHSKMLVAIDWHDMTLADRVFRAWNGYTRHQKCIEEVKMRQAEAHYNWHLKWRVIEHWQRLRAILQLERETDERRQKWRLKIWELLPDYQPGGDSTELVRHAPTRPVDEQPDQPTLDE